MMPEVFSTRIHSGMLQGPAHHEGGEHRGSSALRHRPGRGGTGSGAGAGRSHFPQAERPHRLPQAGKMAAAAEGREKGAGRARQRSAILLLLLLPAPARPGALPPPARSEPGPQVGAILAVGLSPGPSPPETAEVFFVLAGCWVFLFRACRRSEGSWMGRKRGGPGGSPSGQGAAVPRNEAKVIPGCSSRN